MEYPVDHINCPRLIDDEVYFYVHWTDGTVTQEPVTHLIPGCADLLKIYIEEHKNTLNGMVLRKILES